MDADFSRIFSDWSRLYPCKDHPQPFTSVMKLIAQTLATATAAIFALIGTAPETQAAKVTLDGSGFYQLGTRIDYYPTGTRQTGRYRNLGADNYHRTTIGVRWMSNNSPGRSGSLSFEFWGMPFYGAKRGIVLMTYGVWSLAGGQYRSNPSVTGNSVFLNTYRFPELNLWEYTNKGWRWRDNLTFRRRNLL
jgi:hypothetical protein